MWSGFAKLSGRVRFSGVRGFSRRKGRKKRLDEYDRYAAPVRLKVWRQVIKHKGFFAYPMDEMTPAEVSQSIFLAGKMGVTNEDFWERATVTVGDVASSMTPRQLTNVCYGLGLASLQDEGTVKALSPAIIRNAGEFRPGDLATVIQSIAKSTVSSTSVLASLSKAVRTNERLNCKGFAMIASAFATVRFRSMPFHEHLQTWALAGGLTSCTPEDTTSLAQSLSVLVSPDSEQFHDLLNLISRRLELIVGSLEPPALSSVTIAAGKLQMSSPSLVSKLERKTSVDLHRIHVNSLPAMLDAFVTLYEAAESSGVSPEQRAFLSQLTGPLARSLRHLRPQDACRSCQALERLGLIDTQLSAGIAALVPSRLNAWPTPALLKLLQAYANARNHDGVMVGFIRQALLPAWEPQNLSREDGEAVAHGFIDPAALAQLDDMAIVQAVESFRLLQHEEGILAVYAAIEPQAGVVARSLASSCELAIATIADELLASPEKWKAAVGSLAAAEPHASSSIMEALATAKYHESWRRRASQRKSEADTLLLAICAFPRHPQHMNWVGALARKVNKCSVTLLPGLLLSSNLQTSRREHEELKQLVEEELITQLRCSAAGAPDGIPANGWRPLLPEAVSVAALRALSRRAVDSGQRQGGSRMNDLREAAQILAESIRFIADTAASSGNSDSAPSAKALVRTIHALQNLQMEPSSRLVRHLAVAGPTLTPVELLFALRLLTAQSVRKAKVEDTLTALATRAMSLLRSSRQAWELQSICKMLELDIGEVDVAEEPDEDPVLPTSQYGREVEKRRAKQQLPSSPRSPHL